MTDMDERSLAPFKPLVERLPSRWRSLLVVLISSTVTGATLSFSFPLLSLVLERQQVSADMIGLSAASNSAAIFLMAPWLPQLINRLGYIRSIALGQTICIFCFLLLPFNVALIPWLVLRFILGLGTVLTWVATEVAVNALAEDKQRGRIMGLYATVFCLGYAAGPSLIALIGSAGFIPFFVAIGLLILSLAPLPLARPVDMTTGQANRSSLIRIWSLAPRPLLAILAFGFVEMTCLSFMPLYGLDIGHSEVGAMLLLTALIAGNIIFQLPIGWLSDRWSRQKMLTSCALIALIGLVFWPFAMADVFLAWPVLLIQGGALGGLYTVSLTLIGQHFRGHDIAVANTALVLMYQIGAVLGPVFAGWSMSTLGIAALPAALSLTLFAYLSVIALSAWRSRS